MNTQIRNKSKSNSSFSTTLLAPLTCRIEQQSQHESLALLKNRFTGLSRVTAQRRRSKMTPTTH